MSPTRSTLSRLSALLAVAAVLFACGGDDDAPDDADPPPTSSPTTQSPESEVEQAYLAYWDMVGRATASPDPDNPEISERTVSDARTELTSGLAALETAGHALRRGSQHHHSIFDVVVDGNTARVQDCAIDDSSVIDEATGSVVSEGVTTELLTVTFTRRDNHWLVSRIEREKSWDGAVECSE